MIPFGSQRGGGQDLATHLMNAQDNAQIELFALRGAIARDLHGAFAEWAAIASGLTRARQYLFSLSVNPDELQGRLTRAQYLDYIARTEERLGLAGQPRAIVFHVKRGEDGRLREHCHVIWSRTDVAQGRAIQLSFFKEKLMTVTREFARDHGLVLPGGYYRQEDALRRRNRQLSAYDCVKQKDTGISHEERMAAVTDAWRRSDGGKAFVRALEDLGYVLARGRNSARHVLVDYYGHTTALTRLIDDVAVRARHVREFLGADYAPEHLPSVEEAQAHAAQRRSVLEAFEKARLESERVARLVADQAARREATEALVNALRRRQHRERVRLAAGQKARREALKAAYLAAERRIGTQRRRSEPRGLAAFLARVTGLALIRKKIRRYRDRRRYRAWIARRDELRRDQHHERQMLARRHGLQMADMRRRLRALDQIQQRERKTFAIAAVRERRQRINARHGHMPPATVRRRDYNPAPQPAMQDDETSLAQLLAEAARQHKQGGRRIDLAAAFARASATDDGGKDEGSGSEGRQPKAARERTKRVRGPPRLTRAFASAASDRKKNEDETDGSDGPKPAAEPRITRRNPRRNDPARHDNGMPTAGPERPKQHNGKTDEDRKRRTRRRRRPPPAPRK